MNPAIVKELIRYDPANNTLFELFRLQHEHFIKMCDKWTCPYCARERFATLPERISDAKRDNVFAVPKFITLAK